MNIKSRFECNEIYIKKVKQYGVLMPKETIGQLWCCIPLVDGMSLNITDNKGMIAGTYEIFYREVLPRQKAGVIRLPKEYQSCDVVLVR